MEIGCSGQTQHAIHRMLKSCVKISPSNYFFGLAEKNLHSDGFQAKAYFYNQALNQGFPASPDLNYFVLLESFCMADHGRTLAYEIKNEKLCRYWHQEQSILQMKDGKTSSERKFFQLR